ncbi:hypothetical protein ACFQZ4_02890 [Catellatospora coxensis]
MALADPPRPARPVLRHDPRAARHRSGPADAAGELRRRAAPRPDGAARPGPRHRGAPAARTDRPDHLATVTVTGDVPVTAQAMRLVRALRLPFEQTATVDEH